MLKQLLPVYRDVTLLCTRVNFIRENTIGLLCQEAAQVQLLGCSRLVNRTEHDRR